jgi:RNA polymerase sigma-54 factor
MLNQKLQQKLLQKLSPQQIQLIKLLELPTIQLEQRIKKEIEENPILEEGKEYEENEQDNNSEEEYSNEYDDEFTVDDYLNDEDVPDYKLYSNNYSKDDKKNEIPYSEGLSLHEHLESQIGLRNLSTKELALAKYLIGSLDESGYLRRELYAISDDLAFSLNISTSEEELEQILLEIQALEPAGVGARDLQECLMIQIEKRLETDIENEHILKIAYNILDNFFDEFSKKHYKKISQKIEITDEDLKAVFDIIFKLNPKPGSEFSDSIHNTSQHINPDFILEVIDGDPVLSLNQRNLPDLRISKTYSDLLKNYSDNKKKPTSDEKNAVTFVKQKLDSAKWFIDAIRQRQNTLLHTMSSIVEYQRDYFLDGDETNLRPMILKDIADITELDISTISRVANSKYIQTHFGIFPLKYFFSEGMETVEGDQVSTREIKQILNECISGENKRKPLTDEKLAKILQEKGYRIARRTVAKYREQLGILVARLRKEL